jgi:hypothetical protein
MKAEIPREGWVLSGGPMNRAAVIEAHYASTLAPAVALHEYAEQRQVPYPEFKGEVDRLAWRVGRFELWWGSQIARIVKLLGSHGQLGLVEQSCKTVLTINSSEPSFKLYIQG